VFFLSVMRIFFDRSKGLQVVGSRCKVFSSRFSSFLFFSFLSGQMFSFLVGVSVVFAIFTFCLRSFGFIRFG
jgi:hypothetical protein